MYLILIVIVVGKMPLLCYKVLISVSLASRLPSCSPTYNINVTQIRVGTDEFDVDFSALFDSGTSFTYLVDPMYKRLSESVSTRTMKSTLPQIIGP